MSRLLTVLLLASVLELVGGCRWRSDTEGKHSESLIIALSAINPRYLAFPDRREQLTYTLDTEYPQQYPSFLLNCRSGVGNLFAMTSLIRVSPRRRSEDGCNLKMALKSSRLTCGSGLAIGKIAPITLRCMT
jgi:hypothetical protein